MYRIPEQQVPSAAVAPNLLADTSQEKASQAVARNWKGENIPNTATLSPKTACSLGGQAFCAKGKLVLTQEGLWLAQEGC